MDTVNCEWLIVTKWSFCLLRVHQDQGGKRWVAENISSAVQWRFWFNTRKLICKKSVVTGLETLLVSCMLPDSSRNAPGWAEDRIWVRVQTVDCRGCAVYWMSDIVWSASPPLIDQAGNFNLKQQSNYLKTSTNFRTRTFLFDLLNVTRTVYLQSTKKPKNRLKVRAKSTKIYLLPNQQCYDCL